MAFSAAELQKVMPHHSSLSRDSLTFQRHGLEGAPDPFPTLGNNTPAPKSTSTASKANGSGSSAPALPQVPLPTLPNLLFLLGLPNLLLSRLPKARSPPLVVLDELVRQPRLHTLSPTLSLFQLGISKLVKPIRRFSRRSRNLLELQSRAVLRCLLD
jgi:hypothetical protein